MEFTALLFLFGPLLALVTLGVVAVAIDERRPWGGLIGLGMFSTTGWLVYVGLYQHETPCNGHKAQCPTVYGYDAPLPDEHPLGGLLLLAAFTIAPAVVGWLRTAPPLAVGAALALGPTLLAGWTAPRGDNDGLWALIFWFLPVFGGLAAIVAGVSERVASNYTGRRATGRDASREVVVAGLGDRLAAIAIDVAILSATLTLPLTVLSHEKLEIVALLIGVLIATSYFAVPVTWRGQSLGQFLVGVSVTRADTHTPLSPPRAFLRSLILVLELVGIPTLIFALPAVVDAFALARTGRTLTDRLLGTTVTKTRRAPRSSSPAPTLRI